MAGVDGDVFLVVCQDLNGAQAAATVAGPLAQAISGPMDLDGHAVTVTASTGIARAAAQDPEAVIRDADDTVRHTKSQESAQHGHLGEKAAATADRGAGNEVALGRALDEGQLRVVYQPKVSVATEVTGVEALLRWEHPQRGNVPPDQFIPLAERSGLIVPIGAWVLEEACRQAKTWATSFPDRPPVPVSVNVSGRQFGTDIVGAVAQTLDGVH